MDEREYGRESMGERVSEFERSCWERECEGERRRGRGRDMEEKEKERENSEVGNVPRTTIKCSRKCTCVSV